jgi:hypothetical protein
VEAVRKDALQVAHSARPVHGGGVAHQRLERAWLM